MNNVDAQARSSQLLRLAQPVLCVLDELVPALESAARLDRLQSQARERLRAFEQAAAGLDRNEVHVVHYCLCAALDQAGSRLTGRSNGLRGAWLQHGLLLECYGEHGAGRHCRALIAGLLGDPGAHADALQVVSYLAARGLADEQGVPLGGRVAAPPMPMPMPMHEPARLPLMPSRTDIEVPTPLRERRAKTVTWRGTLTWMVLALVVAGGLALLQYRQYVSEKDLARKVDSLMALNAALELAPIQRIAAQLAAQTAPGALSLLLREDRLHIAIDDELAFATGKVELSLAQMPLLDKVAMQLAGSPGTVTVIGHSDATPSVREGRLSNLALSEARALAVARYLQSRGVAPGRIRVIGRADAQPLADNDNAAGRAKNRRVEIVLAPPGSWLQ